MKKVLLLGAILFQVPVYSQTYYPQPPGWEYNAPTRQSYQQKPKPKCRGSEIALGALTGAGISSAVSKKDSYSWSIPLGTILGAGLGRLTCK